MKILFYDLETTGTDATIHAIHQFTATLCDERGNQIEKIDVKMRPHVGAVVEPEALQVAGITEEQLMSYPSPEEGYKRIEEFLDRHVDKFNRTDKMFLAGYNILSFDNDFFRALFIRNRNNYFGSYFWSGGIDVFALALDDLKEQRHVMPDFKLATVAKKYAIEVDESQTHEAGYDVYLTALIYFQGIKRQRTRFHSGE